MTNMTNKENFFDVMNEQAKKVASLLEIIADGQRELEITGERFWDYLVTLDFSNGFYLISIANRDAWFIDADMGIFLVLLLDSIKSALNLIHVEMNEDKELEMLEQLFDAGYELYSRENFLNH